MTNEATLVADPPPEGPPAPARSIGDLIRTFFRGIGQTLITFGVVVLLFIVYEVWVTNWFSVRENHRLRHQLETEWANGQDPLQLPNGAPRVLKVGEGIANLYIPRLGPDYAWTIVQGGDPPDQDTLAKGPAHYGQTQLPGQKGNFAVAGHRVGKGEPFLNLDHLKPGDAVVVETREFWFIYTVKGTKSGLTKPDADGIPGSEVVGPDDGSPLYPVPHQPNSTAATATEALMTMTTCTPKFTAQNRLIVYAVLATKIPWTGNQLPGQVRALYAEVHA